MNLRKYYDTKLVVLFALCLFDLVNIIKCARSNKKANKCKPTSTCKKLSKCPSILIDYKNTRARPQKFLSNSICGINRYNVKVCCRNSRKDKPQNDVQQQSKDVRQQPKDMPARIPNCGIRKAITMRIVKGAEATRGSYPWIAALFDKDDDGTMSFFCGGTLISDKYVITAAHCIRPDVASVRLGAHDISNPSEENARDMQIKRIVVHENFNTKRPNSINDIALIELSSSAPRTNFIIPICLPDSSNFNAEGSQAFIAGWGTTHHDGEPSNVLRDTPVKISSRRVCQLHFPGSGKRGIICAGGKGAGTCFGDSGGPLILPKDEQGLYRYYLLGITSAGPSCNNKRGPDYYVSVARFLPWILKHMI